MMLMMFGLQAGVPNDVTLTAIDGTTIESSQFENKVVLFVNVGSNVDIPNSTMDYRICMKNTKTNT